MVKPCNFQVYKFYYFTLVTDVIQTNSLQSLGRWEKYKSPMGSDHGQFARHAIIAGEKIALSVVECVQVSVLIIQYSYFRETAS